MESQAAVIYRIRAEKLPEYMAGKAGVEGAELFVLDELSTVSKGNACCGEALYSDGVQPSYEMLNIMKYRSYS